MTVTPFATALATIGALLAQPAAPGGDAVLVVLPDAATLQLMCHPGGALDHGFGDTDVPYGSRIERDLGLGLELPAAYRPFETAQPLATAWSGKLAQIDYKVRVDSEEEGRRAVEALSRAAEQAGWTRKREWTDVGDMPLYLLPLGGDAVYELPGGGVFASFGWSPGELTMACGQDALLRTHAREAFGDLPEGTPRPQPPALNHKADYIAEDCVRPEIQAEALTVMEGRPDALLGRLMQAANYAGRLNQWKMWKLGSSGKVSEARLMELAMAGLESGSPGGDPLAAWSLFPQLLEVLERIATQAEAGEREAACRTSIEMLGIFRQMEEVSAGQWRAMDAAIEREAQRVGVSLD